MRLVLLGEHTIDAARVVSIRAEPSEPERPFCRVDLDDGTARVCAVSRDEAVRVVNAERDRHCPHCGGAV